MKRKVLLTLGLTITGSLLCTVPVMGQIEVQSDGAVKIGELSKANNVNGSSLDIAVKKIYVYPTANKSASFSIYNNSTGSSGGGTLIGKSLFWNAVNQQTYLVPETSGGLILGTSSKPLGGVHTSTISTYSQSMTSDQRVKENIRHMNTAIPDLLTLRPVRFDFNPEAVPLDPAFLTNRVGFIAQEVQPTFPDLVHYDSAADLYTFDYISLIPYLTRGIQEQDSVIRLQQQAIETQAEMLSELAEQLTQLQDMLTTLLPNSPTQAPNRAPAANKDQDAVQGNRLYQNNPNPFSYETRINYTLDPSAKNAKIAIYDLQGKQLQIHTLPLQTQGTLVIQGGSLQPGMYFYGLLVDGNQVALKRMVLVE